MTRTGTRRWWALGAMVLAVFAVTLDVTVLTVALPTLAGALKASESQLQWFVTAYTLALVAGMLPAGLLGDRYGRKLLMSAGLVLFVIGSLGCAYAPGPEVFIAARVALGLAGATLIVMVLSIITVLFAEAERPRAIGIWGAANFIGLPLGPIVGGWMLSHVWWGWIFLMNVPVALLGLVAVLALVPESRSARRPGIDLAGVVLSSAGLVALMYGVVEAGDYGWGSTSAILPVVAGLVVLALFVAWERRLTALPGGEPLIDLSLFHSRSFTWGVLLTSVGIFGLFGVLFGLPQYFQAIMGVDPQGSGFRLLPVGRRSPRGGRDR
jgi:DHA2 family multidrug resistance protein-like MFS transporter